MLEGEKKIERLGVQPDPAITVKRTEYYVCNPSEGTQLLR